MSEPKYTVEKSAEPSQFNGQHYFMIWVNDHDVILNDEKTAKQICDALNIADNLRKIRRKVRDLTLALECFNGTE